MTTEPFHHVLVPYLFIDHRDVAHPTFVEIDWNGTRLSITGVEGPKPNGDAHGSCGQLRRTRHDDPPWGPPASGWNEFLRDRLHELWKRWHLNDMRAGCEHQRAAHWDLRPINPYRPLHAYGKHFEGQRQDSWNMLTWIRPSEHPDGLLTAPCPECGYKFGSDWLTEEVPDDVLAELAAFPQTDKLLPGKWARH